MDNNAPKGGKRPGSGRKKGRSSVPTEQRAKTHGLSLPPDQWAILEAVAEREGLAISAIIRRELTDFFEQNNIEKNIEKKLD